MSTVARIFRSAVARARFSSRRRMSAIRFLQAWCICKEHSSASVSFRSGGVIPSSCATKESVSSSLTVGILLRRKDINSWVPLRSVGLVCAIRGNLSSFSITSTHGPKRASGLKAFRGRLHRRGKPPGNLRQLVGRGSASRTGSCRWSCRTSPVRLDDVSSHRCVPPDMPMGRRCGPSWDNVLYRNGRCKPVRWHSGGVRQPIRVPPGWPDRQGLVPFPFGQRVAGLAQVAAALPPLPRVMAGDASPAAGFVGPKTRSAPRNWRVDMTRRKFSRAFKVEAVGLADRHVSR